MTAKKRATRQWSSDRFQRIKNLPESKRIAEKYGDFMHREAAAPWSLLLGFACLMRASHKMPRSEFNSTLAAISRDSRIPLKDLKKIARLHLAMNEAMLIGSGEMPIIVEGEKNE